MSFLLAYKSIILTRVYTHRLDFIVRHYSDLPPIVSNALPDYVLTCRIPSVKFQILKMIKKVKIKKNNDLNLLKTY